MTEISVTTPRPPRTKPPRASANEIRVRILQVAEERFRRVGHLKTSMADIAAELDMSPANLYRFFPARQAISDAICHRAVKEIADIAFAIALMDMPAALKIERLLTAVHRYNRARLFNDRRMHDMIIAASRANTAILAVHLDRMEKLFEYIIRQGIEAGDVAAGDVERACPAQAARALNGSFAIFLDPALIEHCLRYDPDSDVTLRERLRIVLPALLPAVLTSTRPPSDPAPSDPPRRSPARPAPPPR